MYGGAQLLRQAILFIFAPNDIPWLDLTYTNGKLTAVNGAQIVYDEMGNPTTYKGNTFTWEQGRKLVSGTLNGAIFRRYYWNND